VSGLVTLRSSTLPSPSAVNLVTSIGYSSAIAFLLTHFNPKTVPSGIVTSIFNLESPSSWLILKSTHFGNLSPLPFFLPSHELTSLSCAAT